MNIFEKYLTVWVIVCMVLGVLIGVYLESFIAVVRTFEVGGISIPIAVLIWMMIYPMMLKVDFTSVKNIRNNPKGLYLTWIINWLIKPVTMLLIAILFFNFIFDNFLDSLTAQDYITGAVLLGAAPCTAMVFVWSSLTKGNPAYTVVQVATNDLIMILLYVPIVKLLLGLNNVLVPWDTLISSIILFVIVPLTLGIVTRKIVVAKRGIEYFSNIFAKKFSGVTITGLLLTLVLIFSFQGQLIIKRPLDIVMIAIPLTVQTLLIFAITFALAYFLKLKFNIAAPAAMIGASNFFELSVAVAIAVFGVTSPVVLAATVGVLVEVPVMLMLVKYANSKAKYFAT